MSVKKWKCLFMSTSDDVGRIVNMCTNDSLPYWSISFKKKMEEVQFNKFVTVA